MFEISLSINGINSSKSSTTVTFEPNSLNIEANSSPIMPAPMIIIFFGRCSEFRRASLSKTESLLRPFILRDTGLAPVAIIKYLLEIVSLLVLIVLLI